MHNLTKIKLFRILLWLTYPLSLFFIYPAVLLRKRKNTKLFFLFDRYVIGGAQRIHLDILGSISDVDKVVYFTRKSGNEGLKAAFYGQTRTDTADIHFWCDNLLLRLFSVHYFSFYINRHPGAQVFSSNSTFFYDLLPFLKRSMKKTELLHNFTFGKNGMEFFGLFNYRYLTNRVVYDNFTLSNIRKQYGELGVASSYGDRILFIEPGVVIPPPARKDFSAPLKILYAGRGGVQKRIPLLDAIAVHCLRAGWPVQFHFAGTMSDELSEEVRQHAVMHGEISRQEDMYELYSQSHVVLMTSAYEGFPMLIKESMACGCVPVVTALEGNKMHLKHGENALLIENITDEQAVVASGIDHIRLLLDDPALLDRLSGSAYVYAAAHFNKKRFEEAYREFFSGNNGASKTA